MPGHLTNGAFTCPRRCGSDFSKASWTGPVSNDPVTITVPPAHRRHRCAADGRLQQDADVHPVHHRRRKDQIARGASGAPRHPSPVVHRSPVQADVAKLAGVSSQTISRVVNGTGYVAPEDPRAGPGRDARTRLHAQLSRASAGHGPLAHDRRGHARQRRLRPDDADARRRARGARARLPLDHGARGRTSSPSSSTPRSTSCSNTRSRGSCCTPGCATPHRRSSTSGSRSPPSRSRTSPTCRRSAPTNSPARPRRRGCSSSSATR